MTHDAPLTPRQIALRDAFLAELWPTCPELPREQRELDRAIAAERRHHPGDRPRPYRTAA